MHVTQGNEELHLNDSAAIEPYSVPQVRSDAPISSHGKKLIKIKDVLERIPVSRSQLYNMIGGGKPPKPIHLCGGQGAFWVESEIDGWIQGQIDAERRAA